RPTASAATSCARVSTGQAGTFPSPRPRCSSGPRSPTSTSRWARSSSPSSCCTRPRSPCRRASVSASTAITTCASRSSRTSTGPARRSAASRRRWARRSIWRRAGHRPADRVPTARPVRVGLIGFGTIGTGVVRLLRAHRPEVARRAGRPTVLTTIADVDLDTDRGVPTTGIRLTRDAMSLIGDPDIDVVLELIGGYDPARRFVLEAIAHGKDVVTANKALLAVHGEAIVAAAERAGVRLGFEARVGGGIPVLRNLKEGRAGGRETAVYGIVNGTCNHILTTMTREGRSFDDVLAEAQRLGLAEANPATDIDGVDSAHKLALPTTLAFGVRPRFADIPTEGIRHVDAIDIAFARELGYTIKLLAIAKDGEDGIEARVHPTMI